MKNKDITTENGWIKFSDKKPEEWQKFDVWSSCNGVVVEGIVMTPWFMPRKGWDYYRIVK